MMSKGLTRRFHMAQIAATKKVGKQHPGRVLPICGLSEFRCHGLVREPQLASASDFPCQGFVGDFIAHRHFRAGTAQ